MNKSRRLGLLMIISGAALWGLSGPMMQWLFSATGLSSSNYLVVRLPLAGMLILGYLQLRGYPIFRIWKYPRHWIHLLIFSIIGMLAGQYAFIETVQVSNAVTATLFQFLGPVLITIYVSMQNKRIPSSMQVLAVFAALAGTYFLLTNGNVSSLIFSEQAIFWGILTAVLFAFYTLHPTSLVKQWGSSVIVGWGMLLGGITLIFIQQDFSFQKLNNLLTVSTYTMLFIIIIISTLSYLLYIGSLKYLSPTETSILSSIEPLVATILSITWLKESFGVYQMLGGAFIIVSVIFLAVPEREIQPKVARERAS